MDISEGRDLRSSNLQIRHDPGAQDCSYSFAPVIPLRGQLCHSMENRRLDTCPETTQHSVGLSQPLENFCVARTPDSAAIQPRGVIPSPLSSQSLPYLIHDGGELSNRLDGEHKPLLIQLGKSLVLKLRDNEILKAPVIILQGSKRLSIYCVIEQIFRPEYLSGADRFWKVLRASFQPHLETWRPRVHGHQLKALSKVRLATSEEEWATVANVLQSMRQYLRDNVQPENALDMLKDLKSQVEEIWTERKKESRELMAAKRTSSDVLLYGFNHGKRLHTENDFRARSASPADPQGADRLPPADPSTQEPQRGGSQGFPPYHAAQAKAWHSPTSAPELQQHDFLTPDISNTASSTPHVVVQRAAAAAAAGYADGSVRRSEASVKAMQVPEGLLAGSLPSWQLQRPGGGNMDHPGGDGFGGLHGAGNTCAAPAAVNPNPQPVQYRPQLPGRPSPPPPTDTDSRVVILNVGGTRHWTTAGTLCSVKGSFFWDHFASQWPSINGSPSVQADEVFIDRDGSQFKYVLSYLRAKKDLITGQCHDMSGHHQQAVLLPTSEEPLKELQMDAEFYKLPELRRMVCQSLLDLRRQSWRTLYFETGYHRRNSACEVDFPESASDVIAQKQAEGFHVDQVVPGVHVAPDPAAASSQETICNVYWLVTLRRGG
uniref:BTB domain-containing protein n=1 Tax=Tetraselmis sp. GSL018 TaxID=582737 RepID=A0A061SFI3_9CHLO|mmetsp:Transcript_34515/g.81837  ORF Transcript_34515/g.81837 Transcript_34515/m.81837 type:complete len:659 (-) Transcript_34515:321-2297(-)